MRKCGAYTFNLPCQNRDVKLEYKVLKEKVKEFNKKDAKFYGNMFAKMSKLEPVEVRIRKILSQEILVSI